MNRIHPIVYIRADGDAQIGLGHLIRCFALAEMLKDQFDVRFCVRLCPKDFALQVVDNGYQLFKVENDESFLPRVSPGNLVVLDGYQFTPAFQKLIKLRGAFLICIDDLHSSECAADIVINCSPSATRDLYSAFPGTTFLLGLDYVLLRKKFLWAARLPQELSAIRNAFICFGGSDVNNFSVLVLQAALRFSQLEKIVVVTGASYSHSDELRFAIGDSNRVQHYHNVGESQMIQLINEAELAIIPSSGVLLEVLALKRIAISGYYVKNQVDNYRGFLRMGCIIGVEDFTPDAIDRALTQVLVQGLRPRVSGVIDGKSGERILSEIVKHYYSQNLQVRMATSEDKELYFQWANDEDVRQNSINSDPIQWHEHDKWFDAKLKNSDSMLFVFSFGSQPIGQVRFDLTNNRWAVAISVDRKFRGIGVASILLQKALTKLRVSSSLPIIATVKESNHSSSRTFEKLNFILDSQQDGYRYYTLDC
jgi:UDP-2,4-diacetamido-2,4,6-trideoxy-beta-L-altropyranose hydrolase